VSSSPAWKLFRKPGEVVQVRFTRRNRGRELATVIECGRKLIRQGEDQKALELLEEAVHRFPESAEIRMMLVTVYRELRPEDVVAQIAKAVELGADDPAIQVRAGHVLWNCDDLEGARKCATRASELADDDFILAADLEGLLGRLAARAGEYTFAEEKLRSAAQREPEYSTHVFRLARFLWARGRDEEALTVIHEFLPQAEDRDRDLLEQLRSEIAAG
jgi:tetratricopeptide (TPR) repeat protein